MHNENEVLELYDFIADKTGEMLECAKKKDWVSLKNIELECKERISKIPPKEKLPKLSKDGLARKVRSLKKIMEADKEIRNILEPWMARLDNLMRPKKA